MVLIFTNNNYKEVIKLARNGNKVKLDGYTFLSGSEKDFYLKLKKAKKEGRIKDFEIAKKYILQDSFVNWRGKKEDEILHYPDFLITRNDGSQYIIDTKGGSYHESEAVIKRKLFMYQNIDLPYYFVSKTPRFLGSAWVETTVGNNFEKKLRLVYKKIYPLETKKTKASPKLTKKDIDKYFDYEYLDGLFYVMNKMYTKREIEKKERVKKKKE